MLTGCVQQVFFPGVNAATARVLAAEGCDVVIPRRAGLLRRAVAARRPASRGGARSPGERSPTFEQAGVDAVVVNAAGCGSAMKEYERPARPATRPGPRGPPSCRPRSATSASSSPSSGRPRARHPLPVTVAYHDACHLAHAQRITGQPRELLAAIPGLTVAEIADAGTCCGSAGIYNLLQPEAATRARRPQGGRGRRPPGADLLVSANPGCSLQIASALGAAGHADAGRPHRRGARRLDPRPPGQLAALTADLADCRARAGSIVC